MLTFLLGHGFKIWIDFINALAFLSPQISRHCRTKVRRIENLWTFYNFRLFECFGSLKYIFVKNYIEDKQAENSKAAKLNLLSLGESIFSSQWRQHGPQVLRLCLVVNDVFEYLINIIRALYVYLFLMLWYCRSVMVWNLFKQLRKVHQKCSC